MLSFVSIQELVLLFVSELVQGAKNFISERTGACAFICEHTGACASICERIRS